MSPFINVNGDSLPGVYAQANWPVQRPYPTALVPSGADAPPGLTYRHRGQGRIRPAKQDVLLNPHKEPVSGSHDGTVG